MRRRVAIAATIGVAALVAAGLYVVSSLDSIVENAIERYGSAATHVAVQVDSVTLSLLGGSGVINHLTVANPSGFSTADALSLGRIELVLDRASLRGNPVIVDRLTIVAPLIRFEVNQAGEANVDVIRRSIAQYRAGASAEPVPEMGAPTPAPRRGRDERAAERRRFVIHTLSIQDAQVVIEPGVIGRERTVMELAETGETDIGARGDGATGAEVAAVVVRALVRDVATTVAAAKVQRSIEKGVGGEAGKTLGKGVADAVKGVGKAVNDLFGDRGD